MSFDFDMLPPDLLIEVFHRLPFKDRVRLAGVNRSFRNASVESINRMKSLDVTDYLLFYSPSATHQSFSFLESSASSLQSIDAKDRWFNRVLLRIMADFVYPNLERLEITVTDNAQTKKLISKCRNLRSICLHIMSPHGLDWPEGIVFDKLENLEIHCPRDCPQIYHVNLSQTIGPLIGKVPNLKNLTIKSGFRRHFILNVQEINRLLASTPNLEKLNLHGEWFDYPHRPLIDMNPFIATIPTWQLPKLTTLAINFGDDQKIPSSILPSFSSSFPRLHLRDLRICTAMTKDGLIDLITNIPSLTFLQIFSISDARPTKAFIEFVKSTAAIFRRNLEIRMHQMVLNAFRTSEIEETTAVLGKIEYTGGPVVEMKQVVGFVILINIQSISCTSSDG